MKAQLLPLVIWRYMDDRGDSVAFGSTTGPLWVSDGGDSRQHVASHLPPVYCVGFGNGSGPER